MAERRLIDAEAFEESVEQIEWYHLADNGEMVDGATEENAWYKAEDIYNAIENAPTIEAKPVVHAKWESAGDKLYCSECLEWAPDDEYGDGIASNYCPACGAQMDEVVK